MGGLISVGINTPGQHDRWTCSCLHHKHVSCQMTPLPLSFPKSSSTSATFDPASRVGGSVTPVTSTRGEMSTPSSAAVSFVMGFFFAFYRQGARTVDKSGQERGGATGVCTMRHSQSDSAISPKCWAIIVQSHHYVGQCCISWHIQPEVGGDDHRHLGSDGLQTTVYLPDNLKPLPLLLHLGCKRGLRPVQQ